MVKCLHVKPLISSQCVLLCPTATLHRWFRWPYVDRQAWVTLLACDVWLHPDPRHPSIYRLLVVLEACAVKTMRQLAFGEAFLMCLSSWGWQGTPSPLQWPLDDRATLWAISALISPCQPHQEGVWESDGKKTTMRMATSTCDCVRKSIYFLWNGAFSIQIQGENNGFPSCSDMPQFDQQMALVTHFLQMTPSYRGWHIDVFVPFQIVFIVIVTKYTIIFINPHNLKWYNNAH